MSKKYLEKILNIECRGRYANGRKVLTKPVEARIKIYKSPHSELLSSLVKCPYNTGGHGERCKAAHPNIDKKGGVVYCPYAFDINI